MKTIERLRELLNKPESIDRHAFNLSIVALGPALLAAVEAAEKLVALRRTDQSPDWLEKELETEAELDAALRAMEGGAG